MTSHNGRHPATLDLLRWFDYEHLPLHLQVISKLCHRLAFDLAGRLSDGPELTTGLRKLLEAKDCLVRQAQLDHRQSPAIADDDPPDQYG